MFWKFLLKINIRPNFLVFYQSSHFADLVLKNYFKTLDVYILVKCVQLQLRHNQGGQDTHDDPHAKGAVGRPREPSYCKKNIFETTKSFKKSDYDKFVFLHIDINNSCLVKYFWLAFSCLKKIAKHFINNPSETVVQQDSRGANRHQKLPLDGSTDFLSKILQHMTTLQQCCVSFHCITVWQWNPWYFF